MTFLLVFFVFMCTLPALKLMYLLYKFICPLERSFKEFSSVTCEECALKVKRLNGISGD